MKPAPGDGPHAACAAVEGVLTRLGTLHGAAGGAGGADVYVTATAYVGGSTQSPMAVAGVVVCVVTMSASTAGSAAGVNGSVKPAAVQAVRASATVIPMRFGM